MFRRLFLLLGLALAVVLLSLSTALAITEVGSTPTPSVLAPLNPAFVEAMAKQRAGKSQVLSIDGSHFVVSGYVPSPLRVDITPQSTGNVEALALPASYDLRSLGRVTPVRNQGSYGTCWAFAAYGSLESALMPGESHDFSEDNLVNNTGFAFVTYNSGGNSDIALAYLARWGGPVDETSDPYPTPGVLELAPVKHVQTALMYPPRQTALDNSDLKNAVMTHGGVDVSMYWDSAYFSSGTSSYCYSGTSGANHDVVIVGWNDGYSRTNFQGAAGTPAGDGAFVVRNSWGTSFGDGGYFYVSYYDTTFAKGWSTSFEPPEAATNYADIYQYDPLGWTSSSGYSGETAWFANCYTARTSGSVSAVAFFAATPGASYQVYGGSSLSALHQVSVGTFDDAGYHTVALASPLSITSAAKFYVAVRLTTPGYSYPIPLERPISGWANATASSGQSYMSSTGSSWTDVTSYYVNTNVCLKVFTSTASSTPAPTVTGLAPASGPTAGGTQVAITGTNFTGATGVKFGNTAANFTVRSATQITAVAPAGTGSVDVTVSTPGGTSATSSADIYAYIDSNVTRVEQTDTRLGFQGTWSSGSSSSFSGSSYKYTSAAGAAVTIAFTGTSLDWIARKGTSCGIARLTLDGNPAVTVDLYNASTQYKQKVWSSGTLTDGAHTVKIEFTATKNAKATTTAINIDAVDVLGTLTQAPVPTRVEQTDTRLGFQGTWSSGSSSSFSGSSYKYTSAAGAAVTIAFTGTSLDWIARKGTSCGIARLTLDGNPAVTVDLYNASTQYKQKVWSSGTLTDGAHTVKIEFTATKNAKATTTAINIDAVDVLGTLTQAPVPTRVEQTDTRLGFQGTWSSGSSSSFSGSSYKYTSAAGAAVTIAFTGTSLDWIARKGTSCGIARLTLDGNPAVTVDLYNASTQYKQKVWSSGTLTDGAHTVKIEFTATKNAKATTTAINIDAVDVLGTLTATAS